MSKFRWKVGGEIENDYGVVCPTNLNCWGQTTLFTSEMHANRFLIYPIDESNEMSGRLFTQRIKGVEGISGLGD